MTKTNACEDKLLQLLFERTTWTNIATAAGVTDLYISLYTGNPGETGHQGTNEADYTGYARKAVSRTTGWTVTTGGGGCDNDSGVTFAQCTGGSADTITYFGIGTTAGTGTASNGLLLYYGSVTPLVVSNGITPKFAAGELSITED